MACVLTICILVLGLGQNFQNVAGSDVGRLKRRASPKDEVIFFKAFLPKDTVYGVRSTIVFSDVQRNIGGAYNPTTGVFTAPVTGVYEFKGRTTRKSGAEANISLFKQNIERDVTVLLKNWASYGMSSIMKVKKGEHVYMKVLWSRDNNHLTLRSGYFNQFSGYLIRQL